MFVDFVNNVVIDPDLEGNSLPMGPESYILSVKSVIMKITQTDSGRKVFKTLKLWNYGVRITPHVQGPRWPGDMCGDGGGAITGQDSRQAEWWRATKQKVKPWSPVPQFPIRSTIWFTPQRFLAGGGCHKQYADKTNHDYVPTVDEVLFHELVHSVRWATNTLEQHTHAGADSNLLSFDNREEFIAVIAECIYQSEIKKDLRWGHHGFVRPEQELQDSYEFYKASRHVFEWVENWCTSNPHFTKRLSSVKAPFNPLAAYYKDKERCRKHSQSAAAFARDVKAAEHELGINWFKVVTPRYPPFYWKSLMETGSSKVN